MKNLYTKSEYLNRENELINEGVVSMLKGLWNNVMKLANKIKGSKEINVVFDKYKKMLDDTFTKMGETEAAETTIKSTKPTTETKPTAKPTTETKPEAKPEESNLESIHFGDYLKINEAAESLVNLSPEKIQKLVQLTEARIKEIKTQFENEINAITKRLSKNPDYSSDKLNQFAIVMKNQFNSYLYDKWFGFYQKAGNKEKIQELTKIKKENDLKYKQAVDLLNTKLGEQSQVLDIKKGKKYNYFSNSEKRDIQVTVIGAAKGQDENGKADKTKPEYAEMWKVKGPSGSTFWISQSAFKPSDKKPQPLVNAKDIAVGNKYTYTPKDKKTGEYKEPRIVTVVQAKDGTPLVSKDDKGVTRVTIQDGNSRYSADLSRLKPTK